MDNQKGPGWDGRGVWGRMDTCICMTESLYCVPEPITTLLIGYQFSSVQFSCSVVSDSLWPHESQHARPPCPSPTPGVHSDSCPSSQWCHLILCRPLLLLPPIPPSIRVFSNESTLRMRWPKYWSFSFSIIPPKDIPGLIFRMDWLDLLAVQRTLKSLLQHHSSKALNLPFRSLPSVDTFCLQTKHTVIPKMPTSKSITHRPPWHYRPRPTWLYLECSWSRGHCTGHYTESHFSSISYFHFQNGTAISEHAKWQPIHTIKKFNYFFKNPDL